MTVALTSKLANSDVNRSDWYARIRATMRDGRDWCIADIARELNAEKSTVSARLNEMYRLGMIEYTEKRRSKTTGILAMHYRLKLQDSLF